MASRSSKGFFSNLFKGFTMKKRSQSRHSRSSSSSKKIHRKSKRGSKSRRSSKRGG